MEEKRQKRVDQTKPKECEEGKKRRREKNKKKNKGPIGPMTNTLESIMLHLRLEERRR
jgi:hypothetical protein